MYKVFFFPLSNDRQQQQQQENQNHLLIQYVNVMETEPCNKNGCDNVGMLAV